jgi:hypothetical protein
MGRRERKLRRSGEGRPDQDARLIKVRCEGCGRVQKNRVGPCFVCKHDFATYAPPS